MCYLFGMSDVLSDILQSVRLESSVFCRSEFTAPWGFRAEGRDGASFHVVLRGRCWLEVEGTAGQVPLAGGDMVVLPHGSAHSLRDEPDSPAPPFQRLLGEKTKGGSTVLRHGGGGVPTTLLCGMFRFQESRANPLVSVLPPLLHIRGEQGRAVSWLETTLQFIGWEVSSGGPGAQTVVSRLSDVLFIQAVRVYLASLPEGAGGWLRALGEPHISAALGLIHRRPGEAWTVRSLAAEVGMSRSAFAARFTELVGEPPLQYLTRWRMHKAMDLLREGRFSLAEIAERVGYESEAAFSKAFKRGVGRTPGAYRREERAVRAAS
jgi:AraC-like DNA-binding protein